MIIHSNTPTSKVEVPPSLLDMVSERSSRAMYQSNRNKSAIASDESAIRSQNKQINKINTELPKSMTKTAYIYDTFCEFPKLGESVLASCVTESGKQISISVEIDSNVKISFEPLEEVATVTVSFM